MGVTVRRKGFTLLEVAVVLLISGFISLYAFNVKQSNNKQINGECIAQTRSQISAIRQQIELFARNNGRLPAPAARNVGTASKFFGRETTDSNSTGTDNDIVGSGSTAVIYGAVPFQALGLDTSYASDCWGNKFTYIVTKALTDDNVCGGFGDKNVFGNIVLATDVAGSNPVNSVYAYAIVSHGSDGLGAVKTNYEKLIASGADAGKPNNTAGNHGWWTGAVTLASANAKPVSSMSGAIVVDAPFNNGKDAGAYYFDDILVGGEKPKIRFSNSNAFCWGDNSSGQLGDGTTINKSQPSEAISGDGETYAQIAMGATHACAINVNGKAYCWGDSTNGKLGTGGGNTPTPLSVDVTALPAIDQTFRQISASDSGTCAISTNPGMAAPTTINTYCWGRGTEGQLGSGGANYPKPQVVSGGLSFVKISMGTNYTTPGMNGTTCAITRATLVDPGASVAWRREYTGGNIYCWGYNADGQVGMGSASATPKYTPQAVVTTSLNPPLPAYAPPAFPAMPVAFKEIAAGEAPCALATSGKAYCWGRGTEYQLGTGVNTSISKPATAVSVPVNLKQIVTGNKFACGLGVDNKVYCWGNLNGTSYTTPTVMPGTMAFMRIVAGKDHVCGITSTDYKAYCWGANGAGQLGFSGAAVASPTVISSTGTWPYSFGSVASSSAGNFSCMLQPLPPVTWGSQEQYVNAGQLGNCKKYSAATTLPDQFAPPGYMAVPPTVHYFTTIWGVGPRCGLSDTGQAYCWGDNTYGQLGNGTTNSTLGASRVLTSVMFKSITPGTYSTMGIDTSDKLYCWGASTTGGNCHNDNSDTATLIPKLLPQPAGTTAKSVSMSSYRGGFLHTDGRPFGFFQSYYAPPIDFSANVPPIALPAKDYVVANNNFGHYHSCILGNDNHIYCNGESANYSMIGDSGVSGPTDNFIAVTKPSSPPVSDPTFNYFTALTAEYADFLHPCALGDNGQIYCWNGAADGLNGTNTAWAEPRPAEKPIGVNKFLKVSGGKGIFVATGDDGVAYYWGWYGGDTGYANAGIYSFVPVPVPLPIGASGFRYIDGGRSGTVY